MGGRKYILCLVILCLLAVPFSISAAETRDEKVTFNFVNVELTAVAKFISEITGKNFIFDDRVRGKVTIIAPSRLSIDDAYSLFTSVLKLKGFTLVPSGVDAYKIVPASEARRLGVEITVERPPVNESYIARLIPLKYISSDDALRFIQPVVSKDGHISSFGPGNLLFVVDSGLNVEKILSILEVIDQPPLSEEPDVVFLRHSSAESIARILNEGMSRVKKPTAGQAKAVADQRLNAVVLFGNKGAKEAMRRLIALLDVPSKETQGTINVYFLENADAEELAGVLERLLKAPQTSRKAPKGQPSPFESISGITITPDKATNALVIVASPADYRSLVQVIKQLDKRRKQVFVEAMIVEASIDKLRELGAKWRAIGRNKGEPVFVAGVGTVDSATIQTIISGLAGLTVGGMGNFMTVPITQADGTQTDITIPGFAALFSLSEFKDAVNVLSTPQILTSDNTEAEIVVGENVPFISKRERDITTTNTVLSSIERKDVGITLRITPQITEGDYVRLDIYQEISSVKEPPAAIAESILTSVGPTTTKRSTKTSVIVKNRQTVVIGGLMQEKQETIVSKVPILGDIPILGWLFKHKSVSKRKTNLIVFLTPHIIEDSEELQRITSEKQDEFARKQKQYAEGELLVKFKPDVTEQEALNLISEKGAEVIKFFEDLRIYHVKIREGLTVEDALEEFLSLPEVEYAEPNYKMKTQ
jgi:general secretion pathway protein D